MRLAALLLAAATAHAAASHPPLGLDLYRPVPEANPLTQAKVALGRRLFFDKRMSRDGSVACANCHQPRRAFADGRPVAVGIGRLRATRNVPTLINRVYGRSFFFDGRSATLELQALEPILNPLEMNLTLPEIRTRTGLEPEEVARALASYVRTIVSGDSPYDRYTNGKTGALSAQARLGLSVFRGKAHCIACHAGPNFTDERFHNTGIAFPGAGRDAEKLPDDPGRFRISGKTEDRGAFKVPTLREVARTAPYMHDGSLVTLEEVVDYYDRGGNPSPGLDADLRPLRLSPEEKRALVAFLRSLSGTVREGNR